MPACPHLGLPSLANPQTPLTLLPAIAPRIEERWIGYMIRQERQRQSITQLLLAGELGYGMSSISTLEAGHAYANIKRTHRVFQRLGLEAGLCLAAIKAQEAIHSLLPKGGRKGAGDLLGNHPLYLQPAVEYLPIVADIARGRPDRALGS